jgi:hypothetical protein
MALAPPYLFDTKRTPSLWAQGYASTSLEKRSNLLSAGLKGLTATRAQAQGAAKKLKEAYHTTLPDKEWLEQASEAERIAERLGFFSPAVAAGLYLRGRRASAPPPSMYYPPEYYPPTYNVGPYTLPVEQ